jgi:hypothetical protein
MGWNIVQGPVIGRWVAERTNGCFSPETATAIGLQNDAGDIAAGTMFENCNGRSLVAHMAVTGRLTRKFIGAIFHYAFGFCGVDKVILPVPSTNEKCSRFVTHLGFAEECRIRDAVPGGDIILYTLRKADCRFLGEAYE